MHSGRVVDLSSRQSHSDPEIKSCCYDTEVSNFLILRSENDNTRKMDNDAIFNAERGSEFESTIRCKFDI